MAEQEKTMKEIFLPRWILKLTILFIRSQMLFNCADDWAVHQACEEWLERYPNHTSLSQAKRKSAAGMKW